MTEAMLTKDFSVEEFACPDDCGFDVPNAKLINFLQNLRDIVGKPIIIDSACRCEKHNELVGGAKNSQHLLGNAADIRIPGFSGRVLQALVLSNDKEKVIKGIGRSDFTNYVHVDVREDSLILHRWCYDVKGKEIAYYD